MSIWFISDTHLYHKNIIKFSRHGFNNIEEMNDHIISEWNRCVSPNDTVYFLGDFAFAGKEKTKVIYNQLNGNIHVVFGNHDQALRKLLLDREIHAETIQYYKELKIQGHHIILCHYPMREWNRSQHGSIHLFGHCIDKDTEILTQDGFKLRNQLNENDFIGTMNPNTLEFEWNAVNKIHDMVYNGNVYNINNKNINQRVTEYHRIPFKNYSGLYDVCYAKDLYKESTTRVPLYTSCLPNKYSSINMDNNLLKLYICIAADGSMKKETNLVRLCVYKKRKVEYFEYLLKSLNMEYRKTIISDGRVSINFYLPTELHNYNIKGYDPFLLDCSLEQFQSIIEAIENTDGYKQGEYGTVFYTSKKQEVDIIQICAIRNGFSCNYHERENHGFSNNAQYQVYIRNQDTIVKNISKNKVAKEVINNEHFWCVSVNNGNFFIRKNGKISLTGNCHNSLPPLGRSFDVGLDSNVITDEYRPIHIDEVFEYCLNKEYT